MDSNDQELYEDIELVCDNASCGKTFVWKAGEQRFYDDKGLNPPVLCKDCRDERRNQEDERLTCEICEFKRKIRKEYIIYHRRKLGPWVTPTLCRLCEDDPGRIEAIKAKQDGMKKMDDFLTKRKNHPFHKEVTPDGTMSHKSDFLLAHLAVNIKKHTDRRIQDELKRISQQTGLSRADILTDAEVYESLRPGYSSVNPDAKNRLEHIMAHFVGKHPQWLLNRISRIASNTNPDEVIGLWDARNGNLIKYEIATGLVIVLGTYAYPPPGFKIITSYEASDMQKVMHKIVSGDWSATRKQPTTKPVLSKPELVSPKDPKPVEPKPEAAQMDPELARQHAEFRASAKPEIQKLESMTGNRYEDERVVITSNPDEIQRLIREQVALEGRMTRERGKVRETLPMDVKKRINRETGTESPYVGQEGEAYGATIAVQVLGLHDIGYKTPGSGKGSGPSDGIDLILGEGRSRFVAIEIKITQDGRGSKALEKKAYGEQGSLEHVKWWARQLQTRPDQIMKGTNREIGKRLAANPEAVRRLLIHTNPQSLAVAIFEQEGEFWVPIYFRLPKLT